MAKKKSKKKTKSAQKQLELAKSLAEERWLEFSKQGRKTGASDETLNNMICGEPSVLKHGERQPKKTPAPVATSKALDSILMPIKLYPSDGPGFANETDSLFHIDIQEPQTKKRTKKSSKKRQK